MRDVTVSPLVEAVATVFGYDYGAPRGACDCTDCAANFIRHLETLGWTIVPLQVTLGEPG